MPRRTYPTRRRRVAHQRKLNKRQKTQVKRLIGSRIESKVTDTAIAPTGIDAAGTFVNVVPPAQGDAYNQRDSDVIHLEKLQWRFQLSYGDIPHNIMRVIIFRWLNDNAAVAPSTTAVLELVNSLAFTDYQSEQQKVQILLDRTFALSEQAIPNRIFAGSLYGRKLGRKKLTMNQGALTGVDQLYFFFISDSVAVSHPAVTGYARLTYSDA